MLLSVYSGILNAEMAKYVPKKQPWADTWSWRRVCSAWT